MSKISIADKEGRKTMPSANDDNELYEVILIYSGVGYAAICPGIPGVVSQRTDQEDALAMIADAMAMGLMYPLPGNDVEPRHTELRELGKAKIAELMAECECDGWKYEVHEVTPQLKRGNVGQSCPTVQQPPSTWI